MTKIIISEANLDVSIERGIGIASKKIAQKGAAMLTDVINEVGELWPQVIVEAMSRNIICCICLPKRVVREQMKKEAEEG